MTFELKSGSTQLQFDMDIHPDDLRRVKVEPMMTGDGDEDSSQFSMSPRDENDHDTDMCLKMFESWTQGRQTDFVEQLIARMSFHQHEHIYSILMPILQRDFITALPSKRDKEYYFAVIILVRLFLVLCTLVQSAHAHWAGAQR